VVTIHCKKLSIACTDGADGQPTGQRC